MFAWLVASGYYDPVVGRFVISYNLFKYCENNPVNCVDITGYAVTPTNVIGAVGGYFLSRFLADKIGLKGWKGTLFHKRRCSCADCYRTGCYSLF